MAISSEHIYLYVKDSATSPTFASTDKIESCYQIPNLGGTLNRIDVTTLGSSNYTYINGLTAYDDLTFNCVYDETEYAKLKGLETPTNKVWIAVYIPTGLTGSGANKYRTFTFPADIKVAIQSVGIDARIEYTISCGITGNMVQDLVQALPTA